MSSKDTIKSIEEMLENVKATKGEPFALVLQTHLNVMNLIKVVASLAPPQYEADAKRTCGRLGVTIVSTTAKLANIPPESMMELVRLADVIDGKSIEAARAYMKEEGIDPDKL